MATVRYPFLCILFWFGMSQVPAHGSQVGQADIQIVDDHGRVLPTHTRSRQRFYVEAVKGAHYGIRVHNRGDRRIGVVIAVDGRNIISGKQSHLGQRERMYVVRPGQEATFAGWRVNDHEVHRFYFTNSDDAYAGQLQDYSAMGVIALAVYQEKVPVAYETDWDFKSSSRNAKPKRLSRAEQEAGTGFGEVRDSQVRQVAFEPTAYATKTYFKYAWRSTLCRQGFIECDQPPQGCRKNRFWQADCVQDDGYVPYPPQYRYHHQ